MHTHIIFDFNRPFAFVYDSFYTYSHAIFPW